MTVHDQQDHWLDQWPTFSFFFKSSNLILMEEHLSLILCLYSPRIGKQTMPILMPFFLFRPLRMRSSLCCPGPSIHKYCVLCLSALFSFHEKEEKWVVNIKRCVFDFKSAALVARLQWLLRWMVEKEGKLDANKIEWKP